MRRRSHLEREIADELAFHLEMSAADHEQYGLDSVRARLAAEDEFGDFDSIIDQCLQAAEKRPLAVIRHHLGSSIPVGVGLGMALTVLLVAYSVLVRPPATYHDGDAWVGIWWENAFTGERSSDSSLREFSIWNDSNRVFTEMAVARYRPILFEDGQSAERLAAKYVSRRYLDLHGVDPHLGRNFVDHSPMIGGRPGILLSYDFWQEHFQSDTGIVGRQVSVNRRPYVIAGIAPPDFRMYYETHVWIPYDFDSPEHLNWPFHLASGRLSEGVTLEDARADLASITPHRLKPDGTDEAGWRVVPRSANSIYLDRRSGTVRMFAIGALVVALILLGALIVRSKTNDQFLVPIIVAMGIVLLTREWMANTILQDAAHRFDFSIGFLPVVLSLSILAIGFALRFLPGLSGAEA